MKDFDLSSEIYRQLQSEALESLSYSMDSCKNLSRKENRKIIDDAAHYLKRKKHQNQSQAIRVAIFKYAKVNHLSIIAICIAICSLLLQLLR